MRAEHEMEAGAEKMFKSPRDFRTHSFRASKRFACLPSTDMQIPPDADTQGTEFRKGMAIKISEELEVLQGECHECTLILTANGSYVIVIGNCPYRS